MYVLVDCEQIHGRHTPGGYTNLQNLTQSHSISLNLTQSHSISHNLILDEAFSRHKKLFSDCVCRFTVPYKSTTIWRLQYLSFGSGFSSQTCTFW